ncbi:MAG: hypothetical protein ACKO5K_06165 [Armatimonadota bacterium]
MSYNFQDFNDAIAQRNEFVERQLAGGSPVVGVACADGVVLLALRGAQRKCYDIYDRIAMGALGKQADVEALRLAAIDSAHREGFQRSEADVSLQRLVGFGLSPAVKKVYNDQRTVPLVLRALFAEVGDAPDTDRFFLLGYDGEFASREGAAAVAGSPAAEDAAVSVLRSAAPANLASALAACLEAWGVARAHHTFAPGDSGAEPEIDSEAGRAAVRDALAQGLAVEAVLLERDARREARWKVVAADAVAAAVAGLG